MLSRRKDQGFGCRVVPGLDGRKSMCNYRVKGQFSRSGLKIENFEDRICECF